MTDTQFETLMATLKEINENIKAITANEAGKDENGKDKYNLSDLHSALGNISSNQ